MMIMDLLVLCTQTYQTTFQFFILIAHVQRKQLVHISNNLVFPSKIWNNFLQIYAPEIGLISYHNMIRTLHMMCSQIT